MRKVVSILAIAFFAFGCKEKRDTVKLPPDQILVAIKRDYSPRPKEENAIVALDWKEVVNRLPQLNEQSFSVIDQHFGKKLETTLLDTNGDEKPDQLIVMYPFMSTEPIYTLMIKTEDGNLSVPVAQTIVATDSLTITYLKSYTAFSKTDSVKSWPDKIFQSAMNLYPDPADFTIITRGQWTYENGFYLAAAWELYQRTKNEAYFNYIKGWTDNYITPEGKLKEDEYDMSEYKLDDILPGRLCIYLYEKTGDVKYKKVAEQLRTHLSKQPKTSDGGYWHKQIYPYQMWLDGIYMADIFSTQYAKAFNEPKMYDEAVHQIKLISQHTKDPLTGLMYHGWDESKNKVWADSVKGTSPEFWGRAIGWYLMAVVDCLDNIPENHPARQELITIFKDLSQSLIKYQDKKTDLWYQVVNKGTQPGNWIETSCSAMYAYGFAKGYNKGLLDKTYHDRAQAAFDSIIRNYTYYDDAGNIYLDQTVKVGTLNIKSSKGDFDYYVNTERRLNDYKGLGALLYASLALSEPAPAK